MMKTLQAIGHNVYVGKDALQKVDEYIQKHKNDISKVFILVDENTNQYCLPYFCANISLSDDVEIIEIQSGEEHKTIETCVGVWQTLTDLGADKKSLLLNLGGGVITDMGGFIASTFKRGIKFINIPTTLLSMVDASLGGKTGIDLVSLKNQIGIFSFPKMVVINSLFLETLEVQQMRSGLAEMIKHTLIADENKWNELQNLEQLTAHNLEDLIWNSINIKNKIVMEDPQEKGKRKILNFGHTIGHAIESFYLTSKKHKTLLHGEAIAIGMIAEAYLSHLKLDFDFKKVQIIQEYITSFFSDVKIQKTDINHILEYLKHDKKNENGVVNFSLLKTIGKCSWNDKVKQDEILKSFHFVLE